MKDKEFVAEKIRSQYMVQEHTGLDALKALDAKVKKPANVFGWVYGTVGAMILGTGMSLCMTTLGIALGSFAMVLGIPVGLAGMAVVGLAFPVYQHTLAKERAKIAPEILRLTDELLK